MRVARWLEPQHPNYRFPNSNGETVKLTDHLGKVVVLDFWATWCGPCVASLPKYVETTHKFADNQVVFFGVNSTETPESVRDFCTARTGRPLIRCSITIPQPLGP